MIISNKYVTSHKIFDRNGFHKEGLYSEEIFGPVGSYARRVTFSRIKLPVPVLSPACYILVRRTPKLKNIYEQLLKGRVGIITENNEVIFKNKNEDLSMYDESQIIDNLEKMIDYFMKIIPKNSPQYKLLTKTPPLTDEILVLPPALRPISENLDPITKELQKILANISVYTLGTNRELLRNEFQLAFASQVDALREEIMNQLRGKEGILRSAAGKRVDWSSRGVIVPASTETYKVKIPIEAALELFSLDLASELTQYMPFRNALTLISKGLHKRPEVKKFVMQKLKELVEDSVFILNRQPTLHRGSMWAVKAELWDHKAIGLPKLLCEPLNADFDGDSVVGSIKLYNSNGEVVFEGCPIEEQK